MKVILYEKTKKYRKRLSITAWALLWSLLIAPSAFSQKSVSGTVKSYADNLSLPGASVVEKGTSNGTLCDINGLYSIKVKSDQSVLVFSMIGFENQEIAVGANSTIDITTTVALISFE